MAAVNAVTAICLILLTAEVFYVAVNVIVKKRPEKIAFIRGFKKGKFAFVYLAAVPLFCAGHMYAGRDFLASFFDAINQTVNLVILKYSTASVTLLMEDSAFFTATMYYCFFLVAINAVLFTISLTGQRLWLFAQSVTMRFSAKERLIVFGTGRDCEAVYRSDGARVKALVGDFSRDEAEKLYSAKINYIRTKTPERFAERLVAACAERGKSSVVVINTGDEENLSEENQYILSYLPVIQQKSYTLGAVYKHYAGNNNYSIIISRSQTNNKNTKYKDNDESSADNLTLRYNSDEIENKLRSENTIRLPFVQLNFGGNVDYAQYRNNTYQKIFTTNPYTILYDTDLGLWKWGLYATAIYESYDERFTASLGLRADANNYSKSMRNLLDQLSPRLSLSYRLFGDVYANASVGRYYELPPYTALGFKDNEGNYVNRANDLRYIRSDQASAGLEYRPSAYLKFTAEGFYKHYDYYPMSVKDSIPLASKGTDYGVLGNEAVTSTATGRAYGAELMGRWYNYKGLTFIASYTWVRSEFKDGRQSGKYIPSSWDNKHMFTFSGTYSLPKNWDVSAKFRVVGGAPYTPYDVERSSYVEAWDANNQLLYDYSRFNSERLDPFTQLDLRVDKTFYFKRLMLGIYIDVQNVLNSKYKEQDVYVKTGRILNPDAPISQQRYELKPVSRETGTLLPSIGVIIEI